ncbi:radical SAM-associated putative lipoprotein [Alkaliphilus transvaalensis]|uniref:radical SAM-associated putative lipoprotein n=1 Tax=Alkaliphilus transvaalensis TaxID=114628 RepID=UPI00047A8E57|nr:radical SAM-associated putative lipoprotein [Alkaliphilus transvaalensis]
MARQVKKFYRFLLWFFATVIASGSLTGCRNNQSQVAMYGPPPREFYTMNGRVQQENGEGVNNIKITIADTDDTIFTSEDGTFTIENMDFMNKNVVTLVVEDIDGTENGGEFQNQTLHITDFTSQTIEIELESKQQD